MKKSTVSCPTACTNRNCKTCHVIDDEMVLESTIYYDRINEVNEYILTVGTDS